MIREFAGKTEKEAIEKAVNELGLKRDEFDVEIMETESKGFLFKKSSVKIRIHYNNDNNSVAENDFEKSIIDFTNQIISKMGYNSNVVILERSETRLMLDIITDDSAIIIGKRGKNLDAIQLLVNVYAGKFINKDESSLRIILDVENYRTRREDNIVRSALKTADIVCSTKSSRLLEPLNPFERRLVHSALNEVDDVITQSEGEGTFKRIRVIYKGTR
ncbi:protein jag [Thiospirochaeta perfilievii]|uniref:RNA-binding protein KhpB n=1 Tax=Thiospirochaeta perfilievii TaxID=252967 RepID=A0A5C1Q9P8_9SPIO|nr:RNA-binding cell elongation regulator Jag/EloR [Thiospirochaeta perfilievii]QEN04775.1 protein jag [Thiospirochaeta perfilievii]